MVNYKSLQAALCGLSIFVASAPNPASAFCGKGRWPVKTGSDPDAGLIDLRQSTLVDLEEMLSWPKPSHYPEDGRIPPHELQLYSVIATLTWILPSPDSDLHLNLQDEPDSIMVAEIPGPKCVDVESPLLPGIRRARHQIEQRFGTLPVPQRPNIRVQITGVGMFDPPHVQVGSAKNGIEIHPILDVHFFE